MKVIIDRFEGEFALCEKPDRTMFNLRRERLPSGVKEGDALIIKGDDIAIDTGETIKRKKKIEKIRKKLNSK
jgi:hypothetical protein